MGDSNFGVVALELDGKAYKACLDLNALCAFDEAQGVGASARLLASLEDPEAEFDVISMRLLFWQALAERHPDLTVKDAGRIMFANQDAFARVALAATPQPGDVPADLAQADGEQAAEKT